MKLICTSYQKSHVIPILEYLKKQGEKDILFYGDVILKTYVENQGFKFEVCEVKEIVNLLNYRKELNFVKTTKVYLELYEELRKIIYKYDITEIFCDISRYMFYGPLANEMQIDTTIFWTYNGPTHFNVFAPPSTCMVKRNYNTWWESIFNVLSWIKQFYVGEIQSKKIYFYFSFPYNQLFKFQNFFHLRYSIDGWFINGKKIVCGPKELNPYFDKLTLHTGICMNESGKCVQVSRKKYNIYITWGTNSSRYKKSEQIKRYILEAIEEISMKYEIVVYVYSQEEFIMKKKCMELYYINEVNQSDLISKMDLVIFHGGFGTLKECIYYQKKMIVIPFMYDQYANAHLCVDKGQGQCIYSEQIMDINIKKILEDYIKNSRRDLNKNE